MTWETRTDRVKRIDNKQHTFEREYLVWWLRYFQSHDNACDEHYWGLFTDEGDLYHDVMYGYYNMSGLTLAWIRYTFRVRWVWRNAGYGFLYNWLGVKYEKKPKILRLKGKEDSGKYWHQWEIYNGYFLFEAQIPDGKGSYRNPKIGWKHHRTFPKVMYALRLGLTKKEYK